MILEASVIMRQFIKKIHGISVCASLSIDTGNYTIMLLNQEGDSVSICFSRKNCSIKSLDALEALAEGDHDSLKQILNVIQHEVAKKMSNKNAFDAIDSSEGWAQNCQKMHTMIDNATRMFESQMAKWQQGACLIWPIFEYQYCLERSTLSIFHREKLEEKIIFTLYEWDESKKNALLEYLMNESVFLLAQLVDAQSANRLAYYFLTDYDAIDEKWEEGLYRSEKHWGNLTLTFNQNQYSKDAYLVVRNELTEHTCHVQSIHPLVSRLLLQTLFEAAPTKLVAILQRSPYLTPKALNMAEIMREEITRVNTEHEQKNERKDQIVRMANDSNRMFHFEENEIDEINTDVIINNAHN